MSDLGRELSWEEEIVNEGTDFEPLPAGTYEFTVETVERGRFPGTEKMCACNKAGLTLLIKDTKGNERRVFDDLLLNSKMEWKLSQFFLAIGQKKKGEPLRPNWNAVPGSSGKVEIYINEYKDKNGAPKKNNKIERYLPNEPKAFKAGAF